MMRRLSSAAATVILLGSIKTPLTSPVVVGQPGVGQGWVDTLRAIAGQWPVDTQPDNMKYVYSRLTGKIVGPIIGWFDGTTVHVSYDSAAYRVSREAFANPGSFGRMHPVELTNPAGTLAHEFGHAFLCQEIGHGSCAIEASDTLPTWAQGGGPRDAVDPELLADRVGHAMLALRGTWAADPTDTVLTRLVRRRFEERRGK